MKSVSLLDRAESLYLAALRVIVLIVATIMILGAVAYGAHSLFNEFKSTDGIVEAPPTVTADELVAQDGKSAAVESAPKINPAQKRYYDSFLDRYYRLFSTKFDVYRKPEDKPIPLSDFDAALIDVEGRLASAANGQLNFESDKRRLEQLLTVMTQAATKGPVVARLKEYQTAHKTNVCRSVTHYRQVRVRGWDTFSRACSNWYESPIGCSVWRTVSRPYQARECSLQYPAGMKKPLEIFEDYQVRFNAAYDASASTNANAAEAERQRILTEKADGRASLTRAGQIVAAFLVLMFFFLLVAIERHQRRLAAMVKAASLSPQS